MCNVWFNGNSALLNDQLKSVVIMVTEEDCIRCAALVLWFRKVTSILIRPPTTTSKQTSDCWRMVSTKHTVNWTHPWCSQEEVSPALWSVRTWTCAQLVCRWHGSRRQAPSSSSEKREETSRRVKKINNNNIIFKSPRKPSGGLQTNTKCYRPGLFNPVPVERPSCRFTLQSEL